MRFKIILLISLTMIIMASSGCQPSPEHEIVINKGNGKLNQIIESTPAALEQMININHWEQTYTFPNLKCEIKADINFPQIKNIPVFKVEKREFNTRFIDKMIKYFTQGSIGVRKTSATKEELTEQLIMAKRGTYMLDDNGGRWEHYDGQEDEIKRLEEQIKNATEEEFNPINREPYTLPVDNTYKMANDTRAYIHANENTFSFSTQKYDVLQLESWLIDGEAVPGERPETKINDVKISEDAAIEKANSIISDLDIKNFGIAETEKGRLVSNYTLEIVSKGWCVTLTRNDGNSVPANLNSVQLTGLLDFGSEDYVERWWPETITLYVDENGVKSFLWNNPLKVIEEMNKNVVIKSFEEIKENIRNIIRFGYSQRENKGQVKGEHQICINKIVLTNLLVPIKDNLENQMLVPAWLIYYTDENPRLRSKLTTVFAVNSIDGSNIDLAMRAKAQVLTPATK